MSISDASAVEGSQQFASLGAFVDRTNNGNMTFSTGMAWGPDGHLYVGSSLSHEILKFDGTTGDFLGDFVSAGSGIEFPAVEGLVWHGNVLYVLCRDSAKVLKFDSNGNSLGEFISSGSGGLQFSKGIVRGPDGTWYVSSANAVLRYAADGTPLGALSVPNGALNTPRGLRFGPDGHLYVASENNDSVIRFQVNGGNVTFDRVFVSSGSGGLSKPGALVFRNGSLLVSSRDSNQVLSYDASTGSFQGAVASAGLLRPHGLLLDAQNNLLVGVRDEILRYGPASQAAFTVSLSSPNALPVTIAYTTASGTATAGSDFAAISGTVTFTPGQTSQTILVQTVNDADVEVNETFTVVLSNPAGGVIVDGTGVGTIIDTDLPPTKFYVVNDGSPDRTYEYGSTGIAVENYTVNSGNTAPRGAASTAAGDKVWVVDANRKVYVYDASGTLLGSWSAGSLGAGANMQVQGIATNGTDIWIVENSTDPKKPDTIYRYTNAASRITGSQNAASSFPLNSGNKNPTDIVTDGTYLWVVDDAATDKVFRYTIASPTANVGSFTINTLNPTGITLEPGNPASPFWIVDNANDSVSQFARPANTSTSGPLTGSVLYALASTNTNPQGIADPPVSSIGGLTTPLASSSTDSAFDSALLSVVGELDDLLMGGKKRK